MLVSKCKKNHHFPLPCLLCVSFSFTFRPHLQYLWHQIWVCSLLFFSHTKQFSVMPAGYPTIQHSSDTTYPEAASRSHRLRPQSHKTAPHSDTKIRSSNIPSLGSINLLQWLTEFRQTLTYIYQVVNGYRWTDTSCEVWEVLSSRAPVPMELGCVSLPVWVHAPVWKLSEPHILWMLPHISMITY